MIGVAAPIALMQLLSNAIVGVGAIDTTAFVSATTVVMGIALGASVFPAWRGSRIDPLTALRRH